MKTGDKTDLKLDRTADLSDHLEGLANLLGQSAWHFFGLHEELAETLEGFGNLKLMTPDFGWRPIFHLELHASVFH